MLSIELVVVQYYFNEISQKRQLNFDGKQYSLYIDFLPGQVQKLYSGDLANIFEVLANATNQGLNNLAFTTTAQGVSLSPQVYFSPASPSGSTSTGLSSGGIVGLAVGIVMAIVLVIGIVIIYIHRYRRLGIQEIDLLHLPHEIRYFWDDYFKHPKAWTTCNGGTTNSLTTYYTYEILPKTDDWNRLQTLFDTLDGQEFVIAKAYAIYNPVLTLQAINFRKLLGTRIESNPAIFNKTDWKKNDNDGLREQNRNSFEKRCKLWEWNKDLTLPIIPTLHGTDDNVAWKIAATGFATLSALDAGWYGQGIYFTTYAPYTLPYLIKPNPALIISYVTPGNVFPVIEHPRSSSSFCGVPIVAGYNSHYIVTDSGGFPLAKISKKHFDEIAVSQETQVAPAFVLVLSPIPGSLLSKFSTTINRDIVRSTQGGQIVD